MEATTLCVPLGEHEIADLLHVKRGTVRQWRFRGRLPEPDHVVNRLPAWEEERIVEWAKGSDRWPTHVALGYEITVLEREGGREAVPRNLRRRYAYALQQAALAENGS